MGQETIIDGVKIVEILEQVDLIKHIDVIQGMPDIVVQGSSGVALRQAASVAGAWVTPNGSSDPDSAWSNEAYAYDNDNDTGSQTSSTLTPLTWSSYLHLETASIQSNQIRFRGIPGLANLNLIDIDVKKNGAWIDVYEGTFVNDEWNYWLYGQGAVTECRIGFYNVGTASVNFQVKEVDFWQVASTGGEIIVSQASKANFEAVQDTAADLKATVTQASAERTLPHMATADLRDALALGVAADQAVVTVASGYKVVIYGYNIVNNDDTNVGNYNLYLNAATTPLYSGVIPTECPVLKTFVHPVEGGDNEDIKITITGSTDTDVIVFCDVVAV